MNKWLKALVPSIVAALVVVFVLMFSGLATSNLQTDDGLIIRTVVGLDVNIFAGVLIAAVFIAVLVSTVLLERIK
jgi:hypothetical protein